MSRLDHQTIPAPTGMDYTSDPVEMNPQHAQLLVNFQTDNKGLLQANARLIDLLGPDFPASTIDGIAWYYQAPRPNAVPLTPQVPDELLYIAGGTLFKRQVLEPAGQQYPGSPPIFGPPIRVGGTPFNGAFISGGAWVGRRVRWAAYQGEIIFVQEGGLQPQRYNGQNLFQLGMNAPIAPTCADGNAGTDMTSQGPWQYVSTVYDELGRESSPSPLSASFEPGANKKIAVTFQILNTVRGPDRQIKGGRLYRNTTNQTQTFYLVDDAAVSTASVTGVVTFQDNFLDAAIQGNAVAPQSGENNVPSPASIVCVHKEHVILNNVNDNGSVQVSNEGGPTQFAAIPFVATDGSPLQIASDQGDAVTGMFSFGSTLAIWKRRGLWVMEGDNIDDFIIRPIQGKGCIAPDGICRGDNECFFPSDDGIYALQGNYTMVKMSKPVEKIYQGLRQSYPSPIEHGFGLYMNQQYRFIAGSYVFVYAMQSQGWHMELYGFGDLCLGPNMPGPFHVTPSGIFL